MAVYSKQPNLWDLPIFQTDAEEFESQHPTGSDSPLTADEFYDFFQWWREQDSGSNIGNFYNNDEGLYKNSAFQRYLTERLPEYYGFNTPGIVDYYDDSTYWSDINSYIDQLTEGNERLSGQEANPYTAEMAAQMRLQAARTIVSANSVIEDSLGQGASIAQAFNAWNTFMRANAPQFSKVVNEKIRSLGQPTNESGTVSTYGPGGGLYVRAGTGDNAPYSFTEDPRIVNSGGSDEAYQAWSMDYTATGSPAWDRYQTWLGKQAPETLTDYQRQQLALQERGQALDETSADRQYQLSREQFAYQQAKDSADRARAEQERTDKVKANPMNWIESWYLNNPMAGQTTMYDPVGQQAERAWADLQGAKENLQAQNDWYNNVGFGYLKSSFRGEIPIEGGGSWNPLADAAQSAVAAESAYEQAMQERESYLAEYGYPQPTTYQANPNAPKWLSTFAPGQTAGKEITKEKVKAASPMDWARLGPTRQAMLAGYGGWTTDTSGETFAADYEQMLESRKPVRRTMATWRPAKAWAT